MAEIGKTEPTPEGNFNTPPNVGVFHDLTVVGVGKKGNQEGETSQ